MQNGEHIKLLFVIKILVLSILVAVLLQFITHCSTYEILSGLRREKT